MGVAREGDSISGTTASNYDCVERDRDCESYNWTCNERDEDGVCIGGWTRGSCNTWGDYYCTSTSSTDIEGSISSGSDDVFVNGEKCARHNDSTSETADRTFNSLSNGSGSGNGSLSITSGSVFVNGRRIATSGDDVDTHSGSGSIDEGSSNVFA